MPIREQLNAAIDRLDPAQLDELHGLVRQLLDKPPTEPESLMATLRRVQIHAPADFSTNWDRYLGEDAAQLLKAEGETLS